jgi:hypothetical protein
MDENMWNYTKSHKSFQEANQLELVEYRDELQVCNHILSHAFGG